MSTPSWKDAKGQEIPVAEMATPHIKNALNMLLKKGFIGPSTVNFYSNCPLPNGDMAQDAFEAEFVQMLRSPVSKFVDIFKKELKRRGEEL